MSNRRQLIGQQFGRLTVLQDSGERTGSGEVIWDCQCACGSLHRVSTGNLRHGSVWSCGCLARELSSERRRTARRPPRLCRQPGCGQTTEKGGHGYCGKHSQRLRRYGDPDYVTPSEVWRKNNREAQIRRYLTVKPTTYRKLFGHQGHRVVAEGVIGRPLRPDEHVHHRDENKHNNARENLVVLPAKDHLALHAEQRRREKC